LHRASRTRTARRTRRLLGVGERERDEQHDEQQPPARRGPQVSSGVRDRRARGRAPAPPPDPNAWLREKSWLLRVARRDGLGESRARRTSRTTRTTHDERGLPLDLELGAADRRATSRDDQLRLGVVGVS
jgi:hypothetical protein